MRFIRNLVAMLLLIACAASCTSTGPHPTTSSAPKACASVSNDLKGVTLYAQAADGSCHAISMDQALNTAWKLYGVNPLPLVFVGRGEQFKCTAEGDVFGGDGGLKAIEGVCDKPERVYLVTWLELEELQVQLHYQLALYWYGWAGHAASVIFPSLPQRQCAGGYVAAHMPGFGQADIAELQTVADKSGNLWPQIKIGVEGAQQHLSVQQACKSLYKPSAAPSATT